MSCPVGVEAQHADRFGIHRIHRQVLADAQQALAVDDDLHVVVVVAGLAVDGQADRRRRRRQQALHDRRLEHRVAVEQQQLAVEGGAGDPATAKVVRHLEERVELDLHRAPGVVAGDDGLDRLAGVTGDHGDRPDAGRQQGVQLPLQQRLAVQVDQALGAIGGEGQQAPALTGAQDDGLHGLDRNSAKRDGRRATTGKGAGRPAGRSACRDRQACAGRKA
ncbi:MAG: hypothetical protein OZX49_02130 [Immundisolibacter sp.]|nr:hypothetical protein [Immundisolibacter sp.]